MSVITYDFKLLNPQRYYCKFDMAASGRVFKKLYRQALRSAKKKGVGVVENTGHVEQWNVGALPAGKREAFLKQIHLAARRLFVTVHKEVSADGIVILDQTLLDAVFYRETDDSDLFIRLIYEGNYHDNR